MYATYDAAIPLRGTKRQPNHPTEDTTGIKTLMRTISFIISRYVGEALAKAAYDATSIVRDQQQPAQRNDLAQPRAAAQALAAPNLM